MAQRRRDSEILFGSEDDDNNTLQNQQNHQSLKDQNDSMIVDQFGYQEQFKNNSKINQSQNNQFIQDKNSNNYVYQNDVATGQVRRSKSRKNDPADLNEYINLIQNLIFKLTNLSKNQVEQCYSENYNQVMQILETSFKNGQTNNMLLLSRTKKTLQAFISKIQEDATEMMAEWDPNSKLKLIRVNSILSNSESKILQKLCECLELKQVAQTYQSIDMMSRIEEHFKQNKNISVCFILEDIDYYVETTKQVLLYKILDMFGYLSIKFVFIATSVKMDIAQSFEKRIKSRFSHRQLLFYEQSMDKFKESVTSMLSDILMVTEDEDERLRLNLIQKIITSEETMDQLEFEFDYGKNYEYLAQIIRIALSSLCSILEKKMIEGASNPYDQLQKYEMEEFIRYQFHKQLYSFFELKHNNEPIKMLEKMTKVQQLVLIAAKKVGERAKVFNFESVIQQYLLLIKNREDNNKQQISFKISRQVFLRTFLDLIDTGFLKCESETDLTNVNTKCALGFKKEDLVEMIIACKNLTLPRNLIDWAIQDSTR